jgi:hypothetical protein
LAIIWYSGGTQRFGNWVPLLAQVKVFGACNLSNRTMAPGFTQPLTEISAERLLGVQRGSFLQFYILFF